MLFLKRIRGWFVLPVCALVFFSCGSLFKKEVDGEPVARVGELYLYKDEIKTFMPQNMTPNDSAAFAVNYINNWASKQLLLSKSKINLSQDKLEEFNHLVENYKKDLYTRAYLEALVQKSNDTSVTQVHLHEFYEREKENFKLKEKVVQLRFISLPIQFLDKEEVIEKMKNFGEEDRAYLDSIAVQFKKLHFNDSIWVGASRLMDEIPPLTIANQDRYLKKSQFFELQDSIGVYLGKVINVLEANEDAPLSYVAPEIKQIVLNRRKLKYIRKLEAEIIDEAIKKNEFEIYGKE